MCWLKRLLFTLLSLSFLSVPVFSQDQSQQSIDLWNNIDNSLSLLEVEQNNMKALIDRQEKQIESLENAYQNQLQLYLDLDCKYQKSNQDTKRWKTCSVVLGTTTVTFTVATVVLIAVMVNKWNEKCWRL